MLAEKTLEVVEERRLKFLGKLEVK